MLTFTQMQTILNDISYKGWRFRAIRAIGCTYLQVYFEAPDTETGEILTQRGRKWLLSFHMTPSELVTTALKAVLTAEEHETREAFRWRDRAIFSPQFDVEALYEIAMREDRRVTA